MTRSAVNGDGHELIVLGKRQTRAEVQTLPGARTAEAS
jgi:hypothetical protein